MLLHVSTTTSGALFLSADRLLLEVVLLLAVKHELDVIAAVTAKCSTPPLSAILRRASVCVEQHLTSF
jgi:hypothetical protein